MYRLTLIVVVLLTSTARAAGQDLDELRKQSAVDGSLEEVFLALVEEEGGASPPAADPRIKAPESRIQG